MYLVWKKLQYKLYKTFTEYKDSNVRNRCISYTNNSSIIISFRIRDSIVTNSKPFKYLPHPFNSYLQILEISASIAISLHSIRHFQTSRFLCPIGGRFPRKSSIRNKRHSTVQIDRSTTPSIASTTGYR